MISLLIFIATAAIFYSYSSNSNQGSSMEDIVRDAKTASGYLISPGYPKDWNSSNAIIIGLTNDDGRIAVSKLNSFSDMQYSAVRSLLNTKYDFFVYFADKSGCFIKIGSSGENYGYGHPDADVVNAGSSDSCSMADAKNMTLNLSDIAPEKVVKIERFVILNSTIARMVLHEWQ